MDKSISVLTLAAVVGLEMLTSWNSWDLHTQQRIVQASMLWAFPLRKNKRSSHSGEHKKLLCAFFWTLINNPLTRGSWMLFTESKTNWQISSGKNSGEAVWPWTRHFISLGLSFSIFIALTFYNFLIPLLRKEKYLVKIEAWKAFVFLILCMADTCTVVSRNAYGKV